MAEMGRMMGRSVQLTQCLGSLKTVVPRSGQEAAISIGGRKFVVTMLRFAETISPAA